MLALTFLSRLFDFKENIDKTKANGTSRTKVTSKCKNTMVC